MNNFVLLYDCPIETCDKLWLYEELKKYGTVKLIDTGVSKTYFRISRMFPKIKLGIIMVKILILIQTFKALFHSNKHDIMVTWNIEQGLTLNSICSFLKIKRKKIISFCWLSLPKKKSKYRKMKKCLENEIFVPIINNSELEQQFIKLYNLSKWNGVYLPDVYNENDEWLKPKYQTKNRYVFGGGINNRDWNTVLSVAKETPDIHYIIVTGKNDIKSNIKLDNVKIYEDILSKEYYNLMKQSFITICPLKENRASGFINLIKSIQYGIPCISSNLDFIKIYYSKEMQNTLLYKSNDKEDLKEKIIKLYSISKEQYDQIANKCQKYLKNNINPQKNIERLMEKLRISKI